MLRAVASGGDQVVTNLDVASGGSIDLYNTSPISSTDYERMRLNYLSNVAQIFTQNDGTGTGRALQVGAATTDGQTGPQRYTQWNATAAPHISHAVSLGTGTGIAHELASGSMSASSGTQTAVAVSPTFAQTSTAAGIALLVNPSGTFGSGGGLLQSWQLASANLATLNTAGTFQAGSIVATGGGGLGFATSIGSTIDIVLERDAANTLALRRSTNAQSFRVYNTYTDASNYARGFARFTSTFYEIGTESAGSGTALGLTLVVGGTSRWFMNPGTGHFLAGADNTYDIGASGATRPRTAYLAASIVTGTAATLHTTSTALTDYAGASSTGPFTNSPVAGNPTKWIAINDNGTTRYIPTWS